MKFPQVRPIKQSSLVEIYPTVKPVIGVIHLHALPGAPDYQGDALEEVYEAARRDAAALASGGVDGLCVENASDMPFSRPEDIGPETVAALTAACLAVMTITDLPVGITCVANAVMPALAVAKAVGARWVRANQWVNAYVANEGLLNGPAPAALRYRSNIRANDIKVFADVHVKFGAHAITADRSVTEQATDAEWFGADALIATGLRTGNPTPSAEILAVQHGTTLPVLVGSGFTPDQVDELFNHADGAIVGQWLKFDGVWWNPVDERRVKELMGAVIELRHQQAGVGNG